MVCHTGLEPVTRDDQQSCALPTELMTHMLEASTEVRFTNPDASLFPSSHIERSVILTKKSIPCNL